VKVSDIQNLKVKIKN